MSNQQIATATSTTASQNARDTNDPTPERQAELRAAYEANVAADKPPYEKVQIRTLGEVTWILRERNWSVDFVLTNGTWRADLRGTVLYHANLSGSNLNHADLSGSNLNHANLSGADLSGANLSGADLSYANLSGADLSRASLSGAYLRDARMDAATTLDGVTLDDKTGLRDVRWTGVPLTQVPTWPARLGDEQAIKWARTRTGRIRASRDAARAYRGLRGCLAKRSGAIMIRTVSGTPTWLISGDTWQ
jgi:hypothetical protein